MCLRVHLRMHMWSLYALRSAACSQSSSCIHSQTVRTLNTAPGRHKRWHNPLIFFTSALLIFCARALLSRCCAVSANEKVVVRCDVLQCITVYCSLSLRACVCVAMCCDVMQCVVVCCSVSCYSALQLFAVCCRVMYKHHHSHNASQQHYASET